MSSLHSRSSIQKKKTAIPQSDFRVEHHGSICLLFRLDSSGRAWVEENIGESNGYRPYWPVVVIEPRYLGEIINGICDEGLVVR